jgi:hypothetical protein
LITKLKPNINSVEVHPQLSNSRHPVDGVLVGAGSSNLVKSLSNSNLYGVKKRYQLTTETHTGTHKGTHMISAGLQQYPNFTVWMAF